MTTTNEVPTKKRGRVITLVVIIALIVILFGFGVTKRNALVAKQEGVKLAWSEVENQYQRRFDLIPNLVNTVKGYASHEKETLEGVIQARANATKTNIDIKDLSPEQLEQFNQSQQNLTQALDKLMVVVERYPELKADENFRQLQVQLEGTENRITVARRDFNEEAKGYNQYRLTFPTNIIAGMFGFKEYPYFKADAAAASAPKVEF